MGPLGAQVSKLESLKSPVTTKVERGLIRISSSFMATPQSRYLQGVRKSERENYAQTIAKKHICHKQSTHSASIIFQNTLNTSK